MAWHIEPVNRPEQIDDLLAIGQTSFTSPWTREMYLAEFENPDISFCYLARSDEGRPAGFCSFWHVVDELHINNLAVAPAYRRAGVASALLGRILSEGAALKAACAMLEVRRSNHAARSLYERFGFRVVDVRRAYYANPPEDALVLRWDSRS